LLTSLWAISKNSFIEIIRQPVYAILLLAGMAMLGLSPAITMFSMATDESLMVDIGLATVMLMGIVVAVISATHVVSREVDSQTVGAIISKPVGRFTFILGKFVAVSLATATFWALLTVMLILCTRIGVPSAASWSMDWPAFAAAVLPLLLSVGFGLFANYFYRWHFCSTAVTTAIPLYACGLGLALVFNPGWQVEFMPHVFLERNGVQIAQAALLVYLGIWVIGSVAVAISTRLNVVVNVTICLTVFFLGMTSQYLFGRFADGNVLAWLALRVIPSLHVFWVGDQLMNEAPFIPMSYVGLAAAYAAGFCVAMVAFAAYLFENREVI
jgi:ABC-type transport system involved in multi-copper enzyme maturation permease subunit